jgi:hypothetical protein|tara:strand:+ start:150 stop:446 length:297 start_codon:yes stop_codon:yes gene_type:complete
MDGKIKDIIENEMDCLITDVDFVIKKEGSLQALVNMLEEAINYARCCTELKGKEAMTFSQWIERFDFKPLGNKQYLRGITTIGFDVVREKYLNYIKNL